VDLTLLDSGAAVAALAGPGEAAAAGAPRPWACPPLPRAMGTAAVCGWRWGRPAGPCCSSSPSLKAGCTGAAGGAGGALGRGGGTTAASEGNCRSLAAAAARCSRCTVAALSVAVIVPLTAAAACAPTSSGLSSTSCTAYAREKSEDVSTCHAQMSRQPPCRRQAGAALPYRPAPHRTTLPSTKRQAKAGQAEIGTCARGSAASSISRWRRSANVRARAASASMAE
jgi:hypothetical protein